MKRNLTRIGHAVLSAAIIFLIVYLARNVKWGAAWTSIRHVSIPLLLAAAACNLVSLAMRGVRWWVFLRPAGVKSLTMTLRGTLAGAVLNNFLVANGGEAARVLFISRSCNVSSAIVLASLALERLFDPIGFLIVLVYGTLLHELPPSLARWKTPAEVTLVAILVLMVALSVWASHAEAEEERSDAAPHHDLWYRVRAYLIRFGSSARRLSSGPRYVAALLLTLVAWALQLATFALAAEASHVNLSIPGSLAALLVTNIGLIVRPTPGNVGFFQFAYAVATAPFGIHRYEAVAVSVLIQAIQIIPPIILALILTPQFILRQVRKKRRATD